MTAQVIPLFDAAMRAIRDGLREPAPSRAAGALGSIVVTRLANPLPLGPALPIYSARYAGNAYVIACGLNGKVFEVIVRERSA